MITVGAILGKYENIVTISGDIYHSGIYSIDENLKILLKLITMSEGTIGAVYLQVCSANHNIHSWSES